MEHELCCANVWELVLVADSGAVLVASAAALEEVPTHPRDFELGSEVAALPLKVAASFLATPRRLLERSGAGSAGTGSVVVSLGNLTASLLLPAAIQSSITDPVPSNTNHSSRKNVYKSARTVMGAP